MIIYELPEYQVSLLKPMVCEVVVHEGARSENIFNEDKIRGEMTRDAITNHLNGDKMFPSVKELLKYMSELVITEHE